MNKQEQIEKMARTMCYKPVCKKCGYFKNKHCYYYDANAKRLVQSGYINGADFVEWLKAHPYFGMLCPNPEYDEALQEYLKGE